MTWIKTNNGVILNVEEHHKRHPFESIPKKVQQDMIRNWNKIRNFLNSK